MQNKEYTTPIIEIVKFSKEDIITTSSLGGDQVGFIPDNDFFPEM